MKRHSQVERKYLPSIFLVELYLYKELLKLSIEKTDNLIKHLANDLNESFSTKGTQTASKQPAKVFRGIGLLCAVTLPPRQPTPTGVAVMSRQTIARLGRDCRSWSPLALLIGM